MLCKNSTFAVLAVLFCSHVVVAHEIAQIITPVEETVVEVVAVVNQLAKKTQDAVVSEDNATEDVVEQEDAQEVAA